MPPRRTQTSRTKASASKPKIAPASGSTPKPKKGVAPPKAVGKASQSGKGGTHASQSKPTPGAHPRLYAVIGADFESMPEPHSPVPVLPWRVGASEAELRAFAAGWCAAAEQVGIPAWAEVRLPNLPAPVMRDTGMLADDEDLAGDDWDEDELDEDDLEEDEEDDLFGADDD